MFSERKQLPSELLQLNVEEARDLKSILLRSLITNVLYFVGVIRPTILNLVAAYIVGPPCFVLWYFSHIPGVVTFDQYQKALSKIWFSLPTFMLFSIIVYIALCLTFRGSMYFFPHYVADKDGRRVPYIRIFQRLY